jgi:V/A-type H+/Na+-transporting ATPase subunit F
LRVGFIGGKTSTVGFKALGVETFTVPRPEEAREVWRGIDLERFALIFVTEPVFDVLSEDIAELGEAGLPVVTVVPSVAGSKGTGRAEIRSLVERATGTSMGLAE